MKLAWVPILLAFVFLQVGVSAASDSTHDGRYRQYNDSGQLIFSGKYKDTLRHGTFKEYDSTGLLIRKTRYRKGRMIWMQIYRNGKMIEVIDRHGNIRKTKKCGC